MIDVNYELLEKQRSVADYFRTFEEKYGIDVRVNMREGYSVLVRLNNGVEYKHFTDGDNWHDEILFDNGVKVTVDGRGNVEVHRNGEKLESINFGEKGVVVDRAGYSSTWDPRYKKTASYLFTVSSEEEEEM